MPIKGQKKITLQQTLAAVELLREHLDIIHQQETNALDQIVVKGVVKYKPGFSDELLRDMVGCESSASIAGIRQKMFGVLRDPDALGAADVTIARLEQQIVDLKAANTALTSRMALLEDRHNRLVDTLTVNQVAPVRHLRTDVKAAAVA